MQKSVSPEHNVKVCGKTTGALPALAAALAVVAGLAGLEGVDLAAVDLVDGARLGGMALKSNLLCGHPEQSSA